MSDSNYKPTLKDIDAMIGQYKILLSCLEDKSHYCSHLGYLYYQKGDYLNSALMYRDALSHGVTQGISHKEQGELADNAGTAFAAIRQYIEAAKMFLYSVQVDPTNRYAFLNLIYALEDAGLFEDALKAHSLLRNGTSISIDIQPDRLEVSKRHLQFFVKEKRGSPVEQTTSKPKENNKEQEMVNPGWGIGSNGEMPYA